MQLVAPHLNIHTLSYQYSNLGNVGPAMMTTADFMLTFSPLYHKRWASDSIKPKSYIDIGYVFDKSFQQVLDRVRQVRSKLGKDPRFKASSRLSA